MTDDETEKAMPEVEQGARERSNEVESEREFRFGAVCARCGRRGLDDDKYTDCQLVGGDDSSDGPWILVCNTCLTGARTGAQGFGDA